MTVDRERDLIRVPVGRVHILPARAGPLASLAAASTGWLWARSSVEGGQHATHTHKKVNVLKMSGASGAKDKLDAEMVCAELGKGRK